MIERTAASLGEIFEEVQQVRQEWYPGASDPEELWFRGQRCRSDDLLPGLYRGHIKELCFSETSIFERFKIYGAPFVEPRPADDWEWYFLAQHHGLPTRLLDWTESLMAATYFALSEHVLRAPRKNIVDQLKNKRKASLFDDSSPCVWMLDAGTLNKFSLGRDAVVASGGSRSEPYLPAVLADTNTKTQANQFPIAVLPPRASHRIVAQQGMFTLHGWGEVALNKMTSPEAASVRLARISLDRANLGFFWNEMEIAGIGELAMFPDLDRVAAHIKWTCQAVS